MLQARQASVFWWKDPAASVTLQWSCLITMQLDESQLTRLILSLGITHAAAS